MKVQSSLILIFALIAGRPAFAKAPIRGDISRVVDTTHLEFEGLKTWDYEVERSGKNKIVVTLPPFDSATEAKLSSFSDPLIKSVTVVKSGPDNNYQVIFELADLNTESFDYLTDDPSRLIVDFYKKPPEPKTVAKANPVKKVSARPAHAIAKRQARVSSLRKNREPAGNEILQVDDSSDGNASSGQLETHFGAFDAGDAGFDRFRVKDYEIREDAILASNRNIYLQFPMLKMPVSRLDQMIADPPEYAIHPKPDRENKEARLLALLYSRGRYNMFLKTLAYFENKYPDSNYLEILKNMSAQIHLVTWKNSGKEADYDLARDDYISLIKHYPDSPLFERNNLILGYMQLERGDALATLQQFQSYLSKFSKSPAAPQARKAMAEAYLMLQKYDDSLNEYASITKDFANTPDAAEARYRMGDVEFARANWPAAIQSFSSVTKELPQYVKAFPNAHFNKAEALFWNKQYKAALDEFVDFLTLFPTHPCGGYAMTRIGEIMGILGVDTRRSMGAFLESSFRYPDSPGGKVARLRMLTQQMKSLREKDLEKALDEIKKSITEVHLPGMNEFATLLLAGGLQDRGEYTDALGSLLDYYREHPTLKNKDQFTAGILRCIASEIKRDLDQGKFIDALKFQSKYSKTWLVSSDRIDIPYFEARAYERAGALDEAEKIYHSVNQRLEKIAGSEEEKARKIAEYLPLRSELQLRLAAVNVEQRRYVEAYQHLKQIAPATDLSEPEQIERVQLTASVCEYRGEWERAKAALKDVIHHWKGDPEQLNPALVHLARLEMRTNSYEAAELNLNKALASQNLSDDLRAQALQMKADSLLGQKRTMAAIEVYQSLLEQYESKRPLGSVRYKVGQLLFNKGDLKGAENVWGKLQGGSNEILWDMAKETLAQAKWQDEYRKYVKRIPAMNGATGAPEKN